MDPQLVQRMTEIRREFHQNPQTAFKQFGTQERIRGYLKQFGVPESAVYKHFDPTGLTVDISGQGEPKGKDYCVAFRADMDALSMVEDNKDLPYCSKNEGSAHMCGHDGHMTCLLGFVPLYLKKLKEIPSNRKVRLLFQPSEEGPESGAVEMIKQGCLDGVDEVYGFHNWPIGKFGQILCRPGPVMSKVTTLKITIVGTGGHASTPEFSKVAIWKAVDFYSRLQEFNEQLKKKTGKLFVCTLPLFQSGERYNVISSTVTIEGTMRTFDKEIDDAIIGKIESLLEEIRQDGFKCELIKSGYPMTANTEAEANHVIRVGRELLGEDKVSDKYLPFRASEDFGEYTLIKPGAFFFFCTKKEEGEPFLHNARFNFKDQLIETASTFWLRLAMDRLTHQ